MYRAHSHRAVVTSIDSLLHEMSAEIATSHSLGRKMLANISRSEPNFKPKFIKKLYRPQKPKRIATPTELTAAATKSDKLRDAARVQVLRSRRLQEQRLQHQPRSTQSLSSNRSVAERLQESGRRTAVKLERMKRVASSANSPPSFRPMLDPASIAMVSRARPDGQEKVEERLLRLGRRIKAVQEAKMQQIMKNPQEPASMEAIERLMQYQQIYRDHRMMLAKGQPERPTFTPAIDKVSEEIMAAKGKLDVARPKQSDSSRKLSQPSFSFKPELNPESLKIAAEKCSPSSSRLYSPPARVSGGPSKECTFHPAINRHSPRSSSPRDPRWKQLYDLNVKRMESRAQAKLEADTKEICPFRPSLSSSIAQYRGKSKQEVVERLLAWGKDKISKLNRLQREKSDPALEECTFAPLVSIQLEARPVRVGGADGRDGRAMDGAVCEVFQPFSSVLQVRDAAAEL